MYKDKEKQREANKLNYQKHREERRAYDKDYYAAHKEQRNAKRRIWASTRRVELATRQRKYYRENINHYREYVTNRNAEIRKKVLNHYSKGTMKCACCGEGILDFLTIDHVNMDGAEHRRRIIGNQTRKGRASGNRLYAWLVHNNFPKDVKLQVLCANCNTGSYKHAGVCPHKLKGGG
jgi:hypothetical protein